VLTSRRGFLKVKVYRTCIQRVLGYASETWVIKVEDMAILERKERMMVRLIADEFAELLNRELQAAIDKFVPRKRCTRHVGTHDCRWI